MAEAGVEEISGVAYQYNPKFFEDLNEKFGVRLENIVYYKDETHYFVMTALKTSLLSQGVFRKVDLYLGLNDLWGKWKWQKKASIVLFQLPLIYSKPSEEHSGCYMFASVLLQFSIPFIGLLGAVKAARETECWHGKAHRIHFKYSSLCNRLQIAVRYKTSGKFKWHSWHCCIWLHVHKEIGQCIKDSGTKWQTTFIGPCRR